MESYIYRLQVELIFDIVSRLHYSDIIHLGQTSSSLNNLLCRSDRIWKILYQRDISSRPPSSSYFESYRKVIRDTTNKGRNEILMYAARNGYEKLADRMAQEGANNYNEAMVEAAKGGHRDVVERMLQEGAKNYNEAMVDAASDGHQNIVELIQRWQSNH